MRQMYQNLTCGHKTEVAAQKGGRSRKVLLCIFIIIFLSVIQQYLLTFWSINIALVTSDKASDLVSWLSEFHQHSSELQWPMTILTTPGPFLKVTQYTF